MSNLAQPLIFTRRKKYKKLKNKFSASQNSPGGKYRRPETFVLEITAFHLILFLCPQSQTSGSVSPPRGWKLYLNKFLCMMFFKLFLFQTSINRKNLTGMNLYSLLPIHLKVNTSTRNRILLN